MITLAEQKHAAERLALPAEIEGLGALAYNLRWAWHQPASDLFARLDEPLWERSQRNPVELLLGVSPERLEEVARDSAYRADLERALSDLDAYMRADDTWYRSAHPDRADDLTAYFSAEFGLTECLSIYSGGLGVLAGDHMKSASDLGVPMVGVSLLYRHGYFRQELDGEGRQRERYPELRFDRLPLTPELAPDGGPLIVEALLGDRTVHARVWRAQVGRVPIYLLDTHVPQNRDEDAGITDHLYGGDVETRIRQEIVLGIGGYRALGLLGVRPTAFHMNEGHSAFLALERLREELGTSGGRAIRPLPEALERVRAGNVFTTHTPVPAGHDYFPPELMDRYLGRYREELGVGRPEFLALGRKDPADDEEPFCQTVLALKTSGHSNGVSKLHGEVSRRMWRELYPERPEDRVPIGHITNGVHLPSFVSPRISLLCARYAGADWLEEPDVAHRAERFAALPDEELWAARRQQRRDLVGFARERLRLQAERRGEPDAEAAGDALNPDALTIGFARRFATYKRATMLLSDPDRLARILTHPARPVQVLFAGKSHPRDEGGKELIRRIWELSRREPFRGRLVFVDDYDIGIARRLVQGADVWLNNPQRPMEASGTSGMKAAANGALNLSTLDGWWDEAWADTRALPDPPGWAIGDAETSEEKERQDHREAEALYALLEREVAPLFYDQDAEGLPRRWLARARTAIHTVSAVYNTDRMVREYAERYYLPTAAAAAR